jgi:hypothetical protein
MPTDYEELIGGVTYFHPDHNRPLRGVQEPEIPLRYAVDFSAQSQAVMFCIIPPQDLTEADGLYHMLFWPGMEAESLLSGIYRAGPEDRLDDTDIRDAPDVIQADSIHAETMLAAVLSATEEYYNDGVEEVHTQRFKELMSVSINHDRRTAGPIVILPKRNSSWRLDDNVTVSYETL